MRNRFISTLELVRLLARGASVEQLLSPCADDSAHLLMRMSMLFNIFGNAENANALQLQALGLQQHYSLPASTKPATLRLLVILKNGFSLDNTPFEFLIDGADIDVEILYVTIDSPLPESLPDHDIVFIAIAQFEHYRPLFDRIAPLLESDAGPVINMPAREFGFERDRLNDLLAGIPGQIVPKTNKVRRDELLGLVDREVLSFPVIVRPLLSQAGKGLDRLTSRAEACVYLTRQSEPSFYLASYVDYQSTDGQYRKCRVLLLRGQPFICHLAISSNWMVHYQSAGMERSEVKRQEEAAFMENSENEFISRHSSIFSEIAARIGIDYFVIDCAETQDGKLLFFEADNVSIIHAADSVDLFPYKQVQMRKVFQAFRSLLDSARHERAR